MRGPAARPFRRRRGRRAERHRWRSRRALDAGVRLEGWFYWTLMDNYEWNHGVQPLKFGLFAYDATGKRALSEPEVGSDVQGIKSTAKETGEPVSLEPMTPFERKIVHDAVAAADPFALAALSPIVTIGGSLVIALALPCAYGLTWRRADNARSVLFFFLSTKFLPPIAALLPVYLIVKEIGMLDNVYTLVGAGPGDPELLTIKAINAIKRATVLLVDDLVNPMILAHASPRARIVQVGKRGGCVSTPQSFIEKLMILAAQDGEEVIRLKGGDPFIFGRGGEEVEHLRAQGVKVTVINGITAGLAGVTSLGVPLTHRAHAHGVLFITGHAKQGATEAMDWVALSHTAAQAKLTLVIYMGMSGAAQLQASLLQGLSPQTPVAIIHHVSLPSQRHAVCTLAELHATVVREQLASPSVIVVGDVLQGLAQLAQATDSPEITRAAYGQTR